jgi:hypothetical protein
MAGAGQVLHGEEQLMNVIDCKFWKKPTLDLQYCSCCNSSQAAAIAEALVICILLLCI